MAGFRQLTKNLIVGKKLMTGLQQPFMEIRRAVHARAVLRHFPRPFSHVSFMFMKHDGTITGRETGNSSRLESTRTEHFRLTNFRMTETR